MMVWPSVAVLVLNWNKAQETAECVESLMRLDYPRAEIVLIDNGSSDGSEAFLRERFPQLTFLQTGANRGYAGGNNEGIRWALARSLDYLWILNNDTRVAPEALRELVKLAESNPRLGACGSAIYYRSEPEKLWFLSGTFDWQRMRHSFVTELPALRPDQESLEADWLCGCSWLLRAQALREVGELDAHYFLYYEDLDWSLRLHQAGWQAACALNSKIWHDYRAADPESPRCLTLYYYKIRNQYYLWHKLGWLSPTRGLELEARELFNLCRHPGKLTTKLKLFQVHLWALRDFLRGKGGPAPLFET